MSLMQLSWWSMGNSLAFVNAWWISNIDRNCAVQLKTTDFEKETRNSVAASLCYGNLLVNTTYITTETMELKTPCTWDGGLALGGEANVVRRKQVFLLFILNVDLSDGLWAEVGQQQHAFPLQRAVLMVQLQGWGGREKHTRTYVWMSTALQKL